MYIILCIYIYIYIYSLLPWLQYHSGDNHKADKGLRIEATSKVKGDSVPPYKEPYCNPLNDTAVLTYERPEVNV